MNKRVSNLPSLADVAAAANVSTGTASHVLNLNHKARIAEATRARVRRAAEELGYRPNTFARSLLGKKTRTLGLIMSTFENPFFAGVARAVWQRASENDYHMLLDAQLRSRELFRPISKLAPWPVDGLLIWAETVQDVEWLIGRAAHGLPVVYLGLTSDADVDAVTFDFYAGMQLMMDHVTSKGYRKPTMVVAAFPEADTTEPRIRTRAFNDYCVAKNLASSVIRYPANQPAVVAAFQTGQRIAAMPAASRPDVVVCYDDQTAIGVYNGVRRAGLKVPGDIAVTGFDGINEGQCSDIPLTTAGIPIDLACGTAIELLINRIDCGPAERPNRITLPIRLLSGATT